MTKHDADRWASQAFLRDEDESSKDDDGGVHESTVEAAVKGGFYSTTVEKSPPAFVNGIDPLFLNPTRVRGLARAAEVERKKRQIAVEQESGDNRTSSR